MLQSDSFYLYAFNIISILYIVNLFQIISPNRCYPHTVRKLRRDGLDGKSHHEVPDVYSERQNYRAFFMPPFPLRGRALQEPSLDPVPKLKLASNSAWQPQFQEQNCKRFPL